MLLITPLQTPLGLLRQPLIKGALISEVHVHVHVVLHRNVVVGTLESVLIKEVS